MDEESRLVHNKKKKAFCPTRRRYGIAKVSLGKKIILFGSTM